MDVDDETNAGVSISPPALYLDENAEQDEFDDDTELRSSNVTPHHWQADAMNENLNVRFLWFHFKKIEDIFYQ